MVNGQLPGFIERRGTLEEVPGPSAMREKTLQSPEEHRATSAWGRDQR